jgi:hypothetical protein
MLRLSDGSGLCSACLMAVAVCLTLCGQRVDLAVWERRSRQEVREREVGRAAARPLPAERLTEARGVMQLEHKPKASAASAAGHRAVPCPQSQIHTRLPRPRWRTRAANLRPCSACESAEASSRQHTRSVLTAERPQPSSSCERQRHERSQPR